jgi:hypothetical protein
MQLADPSMTPELWEGPLSVPQPLTPSKQTLIEDITENVFIEPCTLNPEPEETYPDNLYMEEVPKPEPLNIPEKYHENKYMDTGKDPDPPEPLQLITTPVPPTKTTDTEATNYSPARGGYFPQTKTCKTSPKKKILPPIQPKMKRGGIKNL